jgi:hypothetical protein
VAVFLEDRPTCHRLSGIQISEGATTLALDHRLLAIAEGHARFVATGPGFLEHPIRENEELPALKEQLTRQRAVDERPDPVASLASADLDAVSPRLLPDSCPPLPGILDVVPQANHLTGEQELTVVVAPAHALDEARDPSVDLDRILHDIDATPVGEPLYARTSTSQRTPLAFSIPPSAVSNKACKDSASAT